MHPIMTPEEKCRQTFLYLEQRELTYVVFMVDDGVKGHIFALHVSFDRLHIVGSLVALDEAFKLTIHN